jgi:UDP-N-acetylmuramoylalanine--D-glutamate ligase
MEYKNKKILVIGLGLSGRSATRFLLRKQASILGVDGNLDNLSMHPDILELKMAGMQMQPDTDPVDFNDMNLVILSPGISRKHPLVVKALQAGIEVIGEIELGCRNLKNPILGITGTNGKTTVTLLVTHVLNYCGYHAKALGNIGQPFTQEIDRLKPDEIVVLELSSYQLETLKNKVLDSALLLNITPDHLDRYACMQDYAAAKFSIQNCLKEGCYSILEYQTLLSYFNLASGMYRTYGYSAESFIYSDLKSIYRSGEKAFDLPEELHGQISHNLENLMAAYALCAERGVSASQFLEAYKVFRKPPHRIEFVLEHQGVCYYDDSKGTNIDAVIRAAQSIKGPIILIAGGVDKNFPYTVWSKELKDKVKQILAIGEAAKKIKDDVGSQIPVEIIEDLEQAVLKAAKMAKKGDVVLLSPGCASFDMFRDYAHRGEVFQQVVRSLVNGR